jgi:hypothetical protein
MLATTKEEQTEEQLLESQKNNLTRILFSKKPVVQTAGFFMPLSQVFAFPSLQT